MTTPIPINHAATHYRLLLQQRTDGTPWHAIPFNDCIPGTTKAAIDTEAGQTA